MAKTKEQALQGKGMSRIDAIIAASGKNVLTPEEVCLLYGLTAEQLANAVQQMEVMVRRGRNGKTYLKRADIESYLSLGRDIEIEELATIAEGIRAATNQKI